MLHIVNFAITSSRCPRGWKMAKVLPSHKKGKKKFDLDDFRPLSILPIFSKIFEILLKAQLQEFICSNDLMTSRQSGFRPKHSTTTALLRISYDIKMALNRKLISVLLLLDFTKAFDMVDHDILCDKLRSMFYFSTSAISLVRSYLSDRSQAVCVDGVMSAYLPVAKGVPQGSILGPLLFALFVSDLPETIRYMFPHLFADDVQLYKHFSTYDVRSCVKRINDDLRAVSSWARGNRLMLNAGKTQVL